MRPELYSLSLKGALFIARREAFVSVAYPDGDDLSYGFGSNSPDLRKGDEITLEKALDLFVVDIRTREPIVNRALKTKVKQHQFDALFSLYYNVGTKALLTIANLWNKRHISAGIDLFTNYVRVKQRDANGRVCLDEKGKPIMIVSQGLIRRRAMEQNISRHADYGDLSRFPAWKGDPEIVPMEWVTFDFEKYLQRREANAVA